MSSTQAVVVVGAGLAGLAAADRLVQAGIDVVVLEASPRAGGRVHTTRLADGTPIESGMQEFWEGTSAYELVEELGLPLDVSSARSSVVLDGRLHEFDHRRPAAQLDLMFDRERDHVEEWIASIRPLLPVRSPRGDAPLSNAQERLQRVDLRRFLVEGALPRRAVQWARVMVEAETSATWEDLAALDGLDELRPFLWERGGDGGARNAHVTGGNRRVVEALVERIGAERVWLDTRVEQLVDRAGRVEVAARSAAGACRHLTARQVLVTVPTWALDRIGIGPALGAHDRRVQGAAGSVPYVKVHLRVAAGFVDAVFDGADPFPILTDGPCGCVYRGQAANGDDVITMLVHARWAAALSGLPGPVVAGRATAALESLFRCHGRGRVRRALPVVEAVVHDHPRAIAHWSFGSGRSRFDASSRELRTPHGNVHIGGDTTDGTHSHAAVAAGLRLAADAAERLGALVAVGS